MTFATTLPFTTQSALRSLVSEESVMRMRSTLFTGYPTLQQSREASDAPPEQPITTQYTPAQTMALLTLRNSELALAVLAKLNHSTARPDQSTHSELRGLHLATMERDGPHLTPLGHFKANMLAYALAEQLEVPIPTYKPERQRHDGYRRGLYTPGTRSTFNPW